MAKYEIKTVIKNKNRIKELREINGYPLKDFHKLVGLNEHSYRSMERKPVGQGSIRPYLVLANFYGVTLDYLLGFDPVPTIDRTVVNHQMLKKLQEMEELSDEANAATTHPKTQTLDEFLNFENIKYDEYPVNLLCAIFDRNVINKTMKFTKSVTEDLEKLLTTYLTDREVYLLKLRYVNKLALRPTAKLLNITAEHVRQLELKVLSKLKNEYVMNKLTYNIDKDIEEKEKRLETLKAEVDYYENLCKNSNIKIVNVGNSNELKLSELRLPYRSHNTLKSYGIKYLKDLLLLIDNPQIFKIPNFGKKTYMDTLYRLKELNFINFNDNIKTARKCMKTVKIIQ